MHYTGTNLTERISKEWDGSWKNKDKENFLYTGANMTQMIQSDWDETSSSWYFDFKDSYTYIGSDISACISESYDLGSKKWQNFSRFTSTFSSGIMQGTVFENFFTGTWLNTTKYDYTFTAGRISKVLYSDWTTSTSSWISGYKTDYSYNPNNNITRIKGDKWDGSSWTYGFDNKFYYESYTGIRNDTPYVSNASIYPNPATGPNVYVDYFTEKYEPTEVILTNVMGQPLFRFNEQASIGDHSVLIPVASLPQGIYVVSIYCNGICSKTMKLVK